MVKARSGVCRCGLELPVAGVVVPIATGEWIELRLRFAAVKAARTLLSLGASVEVMSPPEVQADLAALAAEIADLYSNVRLD